MISRIQAKGLAEVREDKKEGREVCKQRERKLREFMSFFPYEAAGKVLCEHGAVGKLE